MSDKTVMKQRIETIKQKLKQARDRKLKCFGSEAHKFNSQLVPKSAVEGFESTYSITLPEEYRAFLLEVGIGAGPYYGLQKLGVGWVCDEETEEGEKTWLSSPCLIEPLMCEGVGHTGWDDALEKQGHPWERHYQGIMEIVSQGCTYLSGLVVTGPYRGHILGLDMDRQTPHFDNSSFLGWYETWLDNVLAGEKYPSCKAKPKE